MEKKAKFIRMFEDIEPPVLQEYVIYNENDIISGAKELMGKV